MSSLATGAAAARAQYDLAFQISPIILQGGIASGAQGGMLPIISLYKQSTSDTTFFPRFLPLPGSTLISNAIGLYPFANQQVAANAIIQEPLTLSMLMIAPVNQPGGYLAKLTMFQALQSSLQQHNNAGGTYSVATPAYIYNYLLMKNMSDVSNGENPQQQIRWQIDFMQPLITLQAAAAAQNALITRITSGSSFPAGTLPSAISAAQSPTNTQGLTGALTAALGVFGGQFGASPDTQGVDSDTGASGPGSAGGG